MEARLPRLRRVGLPDLPSRELRNEATASRRLRPRGHAMTSPAHAQVARPEEEGGASASPVDQLNRNRCYHRL